MNLDGSRANGWGWGRGQLHCVESRQPRNSSGTPRPRLFVFVESFYAVTPSGSVRQPSFPSFTELLPSFAEFYLVLLGLTVVREGLTEFYLV